MSLPQLVATALKLQRQAAESALAMAISEVVVSGEDRERILKIFNEQRELYLSHTRVVELESALQDALIDTVSSDELGDTVERVESACLMTVEQLGLGCSPDDFKHVMLENFDRLTEAANQLETQVAEALLATVLGGNTSTTLSSMLSGLATPEPEPQDPVETTLEEFISEDTIPPTSYSDID